MSYRLMAVGSFVLAFLFAVSGLMDTLISVLTWNFRGTHHACAFAILFFIVGKLCLDKVKEG